MVKTKKITYLILILILLISLFLRAYDIGGVFKSSDEIEVQSAVVRSFPRSISSFNFLDEAKKTPNPLTLFLQGHNMASYLLGLVIFSFYALLGIPITEFTWNLPSALIGVLNIFVIYLLVKHLFDEKSALISSLFVGLLPMQVYPSRYVGISHLFLDFFFLTLTIYLFCGFFKEPSRKNAIFSSISLAFYMTASMFFPLIFILIIFIGMVYLKEKKRKPYPVILLFKDTLKALFRIDLLFAPIIVASFFLITNIVNLILHQKLIGVIGHVFYSKGAKFGFHIVNFIKSSVIIIGLVGIIVLVFCLLILLKNHAKIKKIPILLCWFVVYSVPFLFMFSREPWLTASYLMWAFGAFILLMAVILSNSDKFFRKKYSFYVNSVKYLLIFAVAFSFLLGDLSVIFGINTIKIFDVGNYGTFGGEHYPIQEDFGVKTAGYWIRKNTGNSSIIFSDYYREGAGIEPPVADYYFHRNTYCLYDGNDEMSLSLFDKIKDKVDILVLDAENTEIFEDKIRGFNKAANIVDGNGKVKLIIYSRKPYELTDLSIEKGNKYYDADFSDFRSMIDCSDCHSARLIFNAMS